MRRFYQVVLTVVMNTTPVLSERENSKIKIDKFEVAGDNDDDGDHVEAGGVQACRRQAGCERAWRKNHTEAFQLGQQLFTIISMIKKVINYDFGYEVICR